MATLAELKAKLQTYQAAEDAIVLGAQSYEIAGRKITKANLSVVREAVRDLEMRIAMLSGPTCAAAVFGGSR